MFKKIALMTIAAVIFMSSLPVFGCPCGGARPKTSTSKVPQNGQQSTRR